MLSLCLIGNDNTDAKTDNFFIIYHTLSYHIIHYHTLVMHPLYGYQWEYNYDRRCIRCNVSVPWNLAIVGKNGINYCPRCYSEGFEIQRCGKCPYIVLQRLSDTETILINNDYDSDIIEYGCIRRGNTYIGDYNETVWRILCDLFHNKYRLSPEKYDVEFVFDNDAP